MNVRKKTKSHFDILVDQLVEKSLQILGQKYFSTGDFL